MIEILADKCSHCGAKDRPMVRNSSRVSILKGTRRVYFWCRPCSAERIARYASTERGREVIRAALRKSTKKHSFKQDARLLVAAALSKGLLEKKPCEVCGEVVVQGHHPDYSKPLEVTWLCRSHHADVHSKNKDFINSTSR